MEPGLAELQEIEGIRGLLAGYTICRPYGCGFVTTSMSTGQMRDLIRLERGISVAVSGGRFMPLPWPHP